MSKISKRAGILVAASALALLAAPAFGFGGRPGAHERQFQSEEPDTGDTGGPVVPEPTAALLFGAGALVLATARRKQAAR